MIKKLLICAFPFFISLIYFHYQSIDNNPSFSIKKTGPLVRKVFNPTKSDKKLSYEERQLFNEARIMDEFYRLANPVTGTIPREELRMEKLQAERSKKSNARNLSFLSRGPSNLGGRTRTLVIDASDATSNTILAGGVSGGVFRTTDGGSNWTRVNPTGEIHNVTTIAQDPSNTSLWYYGTGELQGNSASNNASFYLGQGIWQSNNGGISWSQIPGTNSAHELFNSVFDVVHRIAVHPTTGDLYAACGHRIMRWDGVSWSIELSDGAFNGNEILDIVIASTGRVYAAFSGSCDAATEGVWTSATGTGGWTRIADPYTNPAAFRPRSPNSGRIVLALAPSNQNLLYALYEHNRSGADFTNGNGGEAHLWRWNLSTGSWNDFSTKLPNEPGGSVGNDPMAIQGAYDLCVSVKPDNQNFVVVGGTNAYKIANINTDPEFVRIGGYDGPSTYALWNNGGGDTHHPDVHTLVFDPNNSNRMFSGTDGGVHRTNNINATTVGWVNLNNNYQTYQYYHVAMDPQAGSNGVLGGAQDNGTTAGGTDFGLPDNTQQGAVFSGDGVAVGISRDDACTPFFFGSQNGNMRRDCPTNAQITPTGSSSEFVTYFYLDPDNNSNIYYAGENRVYKSANSSAVTTGVGGGGNQWQDLGPLNTLPGAPTDFVKTFATSRGPYSTSSILLIGGDEGKIFKLTNPANRNTGQITSAVNITPAGASTTFPSIVSGLAFHPSNPDLAIATYSNYGIPSIYISNNITAASPTWTLVERNLSAHSIRSCMITEVAGEIQYWVGTARGLYRSPDPLNEDWIQEGVGSIDFAIVRSLVYRPADNKVLVGTHGNAMFEATIPFILSNGFIELTGNLSDDNLIDLSWTTLDEKGNDRFEIERSFDGINYEKIAAVESQGDNADEQTYRLRDEDIVRKVQYYRIRTVEISGGTSLSNIIAIETNLEDAIDVRIYPNPVMEEINIELGTIADTDVEVLLYNTKGQLIKTEMIAQNSRTVSIDINKEGLRPGLYMIKLKKDNDYTIIKRFIKR